MPIYDQQGEPLHERRARGLYRLGKIKLGAPKRSKGKYTENLPTFRFGATETSELRMFEMRRGDKAKQSKEYQNLVSRATKAQAALDKQIKAALGTLTPDRLCVWLPSENPMEIVTYDNKLWGGRATLRCYCDGRMCHPLQKDGTRPEREVPKNDSGALDCKFIDQCRLSILINVQLPDFPGGQRGVFQVETGSIYCLGSIFTELENIRGEYGRLMRADVELHKLYEATKYRENGQWRESWQWIVHLAPWGETLREAVERESGSNGAPRMATIPIPTETTLDEGQAPEEQIPYGVPGDDEDDVGDDDSDGSGDPFAKDNEPDPEDDFGDEPETEPTPLEDDEPEEDETEEAPPPGDDEDPSGGIFG